MAQGTTQPTEHPSHHKVVQKPSETERLETRNAHDLANVMWTEARGEGTDAMTAVGWTLKNRMDRYDTTQTTQTTHATHTRTAWKGYRHGQTAPASAFSIAMGILNGTIPDPTDGATHFYTPRIMPKKGDATRGYDVGGGLESVDGVTKNGKPIQNYRPDFSLQYTRKPVAGIPEASFKFYQQPGTRRVH